LYISFPKNYSTKDTITYPVLYVLDGEFNSSFVKGMRKQFQFENEIEDVIIVGIGSGLDFLSWYSNRYNNYTTTVSIAEDEKRKKKMVNSKERINLEEQLNFLNPLKPRSPPFLNKNYKTNADRGITGHSLGGLFTAYCLINSDGYFTRFGIGSPSFCWDNEKVLNQAVAQFTENKIWDLPQTKVFISVGDQEEEIVPMTLKCSSSLENKGYYKKK
jgi:predicted alpha/beta superfamily hydrolase